MLAIGFDPGTRYLGWGLVRREGTRVWHQGHGVLRLDGSQPLAERLVHIERGVAQLLEEHRPDVGSVESLFFHKDPQAAAKLGHARGVILLCLARAGLKVFEYPPARVKRTMTGNGQAEKRQVALMVKGMLALSELPAADAADALAIALTHLRLGPLSGAAAENAQLLEALASGQKRSRQRRASLIKQLAERPARSR